jgi:hypothetical protein
MGFTIYMVVVVIVNILHSCTSSPLHSFKLHYRGGSSDGGVLEDKEDTSPITVVVSTSFGSTFLDKKKRIQISRNSSVAQLKDLIEAKFPASPPVQLQRLFLGVRHLQDEEVLGNITTTNAQILLDMPSGTSVYNKSLTIAQALEAYSSLIVQQTYLGDKLKSMFGDKNKNAANVSEFTPESSVYRELFISLNDSLYKAYSDDIMDAFEIEKEPETIEDDTAPWRAGTKKRSPLVAAFAKEFDINVRSFKSFIYFSFLFAVRSGSSLAYAISCTYMTRAYSSSLTSEQIQNFLAIYC